MFQKIKEKFYAVKSKIQNVFKEMEEQERKREIAKYSDFVYDCFKKESNTIIGNFSYEGYKRIFENMIGEAKHSIYVFCENYDLIFTDELFCLFKFKADSGIKVRIITYGENREPKFEPFNEYHSDCRYVSVHTEHPERMNNFIVVDEKSYWIDDKAWFDRKDFSRLKACANFRDFFKCAKMIDICNKAIEVAEVK